jgi:hypothetical protein
MFKGFLFGVAALLCTACTNPLGGNSGVQSNFLSRAPASNGLAGQNQTININYNVTSPIQLSASGGTGTYTYTIMSQPTNGTLTGAAPSVIYTPTPGYTGNDSFTFQVNDGQNKSAIATITLAVQPSAPNNSFLQGSASASYNNWNYPGYVASMAIDSDVYGSRWTTYSQFSIFPQWWEYDRGGNSSLVNYYTFWPFLGESDGRPTAWTLQGSNDGTAWDILDSRSGITLNEPTNFPVTTTNTYSIYRFSFTDSNTGRGKFVQIANFQLGYDHSMNASWAPEWNNLVGYWKLDELSSGTVGGADFLDSTGSGNNGTASGGVVLGLTGAVKSAATFNGSNGIITLPQLPVSGTSDFSFSSWIKTSTTGTRQQILTIGNNNTNQGAWFFVNTANQLEFDLSNVAGPTSTATVVDGIWHHVGVTNKSGSIQLYVDGLASGPPFTMAVNLQPGTNLIGNGINGYSWFFNGLIDDVAVWKSALSASEMWSVYYTESAGLRTPSTYISPLTLTLTQTEIAFGSSTNYAVSGGSGDYMVTTQFGLVDTPTGSGVYTSNGGAGTDTITVYDNQTGATTSATVVVDAPTDGSATINLSQTTIPYGGSTYYTISGGSGNFYIYAQNNYVDNNYGSGNYYGNNYPGVDTITLYDYNTGSYTYASITVQPPAPLTITISPTEIGYGGNAQYSVSGGSGNYSGVYSYSNYVDDCCGNWGNYYAWYNYGTDTVCVYDNILGNTACTTITVDPPPPPSIYIDQSEIPWGGSANIYVSGGTGNYSVSAYYGSVNNWCWWCGSQYSYQGTGDTNGYTDTVVVYDTSTGFSSSTTIIVDPLPPLTITLDQNEISPYGSTGVTFSGGTGNYGYSANNGAVNFCGWCYNGDAYYYSSYGQAYTDTIYLYDYNTGYSTSVNIIVDAQSPLTISVNPTEISATGTAQFSISGGSGNFYVSAANGYVDNPYTTSGNYYPNGFTGTDTISVYDYNTYENPSVNIVVDPPSVSIAASPVEVMTGGTIAYTISNGSGNYTVTAAHGVADNCCGASGNYVSNSGFVGTDTLTVTDNSSGTTSTVNVIIDAATTPSAAFSWMPQWSNLAGYWQLHGSSSIPNQSLIPALVGPFGSAMNSNQSGMTYTASDDGINLDGVDDAIDIPSTAGLNAVQNFTVSLWINLPTLSPSSSGIILSKGPQSSGGINWHVVTQPGGNFYFGYYGNYSTTVSGLTANHWHHIVFTVNSVAGTATVTPYLDGVAQTTVSGPAWVDLSQADLFMGSYPTGSPINYHGGLADVAIWSSTLSASDVQTLYTNQSSDFVHTGSITGIGIVANGSSRNWSDGTYASSCNVYLHPPTGYSYQGVTGSGIYTINPGSGNTNVYCDMTTNGGGWTILFNSTDASKWLTSTGTPGVNQWSTSISGWSSFTSTSVILIQGNTGNNLVVPGVTQAQLAGCATGSNSLTWNGTVTNGFGALHLGIVNSATTGPNWGTGYVAVGDGCTADDQGWGFGHNAFINVGQGWGWDSLNQNSQKFQIGVR